MSPLPRPRPVVLTSTFGFDQLRRELRRGEIERLRRGAYVEPIAPGVDPWQQREADVLSRCQAVAASLRCSFAFSHETAAALRSWQAPVTDTVHIVQRFRPGQSRSDDVIRHYCPDLDEQDVVWLHGLPVTAAERTAVDCALLSSPPVALAIVDAALRSLGSVSRFRRAESSERQETIRADLLERLADRGSVRHVRRAREVLVHANGFAELGGESWLRWLALVQGLPAPELQVPIATARGVFYPDAMWPESMVPGGRPVLAEYDGVDKYAATPGGRGPGERVVRQTDREQLLVDATGARVLRFTKHDRRDPNGGARRLLRAFPSGMPRTPRPLLLSRRPRR
ncbi:hypothetical protein GCM10027067_04570 [Pseudactinotalea suaedae]